MILIKKPWRTPLHDEAPVTWSLSNDATQSCSEVKSWNASFRETCIRVTDGCWVATGTFKRYIYVYINGWENIQFTVWNAVILNITHIEIHFFALNFMHWMNSLIAFFSCEMAWAQENPSKAVKSIHPNRSGRFRYLMLYTPTVIRTIFSPKMQMVLALADSHSLSLPVLSSQRWRVRFCGSEFVPW